MCAHQTRPTASGTIVGNITAADRLTTAPMYECAASYAIAPTRGPARYPTNERSGIRNVAANTPHPAPNFEYAARAATSTTSPSIRRTHLTAPVAAPTIDLVLPISVSAFPDTLPRC